MQSTDENARERLPAAGLVTFTNSASAQDECDRLLCSLVRALPIRLGRPAVIGLCGAQGSGKSTTAKRLAQSLTAAGLAVAILSLDDLYHPKQVRELLAQQVQPLLRTRGVPGTHDVALGLRVISNLVTAPAGSVTLLPRFEKALDERRPPAQWEPFEGRPDVVLFEGWCIGAVPQREDQLETPANELERLEDPQGTWRRYVNEQLSGEYRQLFALLDYTIFLRAPAFERILAWREEQELHTAAKAAGVGQVMSRAELIRFIAHYERITRQLLREPQADVVVELAPDRTPLELRLPPAPPGGAPV